MSVHDDAVSADLAPSLEPLRLPHLLLLAGAVLGCAALFALTVGHGYLVNDLQRVPLDRLASAAPAPRDLPVPPSATTQLLGYLAIVTTPLVGFVGLLVAGVDAVASVRGGRTPRQVGPAAAVAALSAAVLVGCAVLSPLATWWLD
ncbi:hypothetical protein [Quadrisphaera sp. KR29]|uniref:hypothetical protein n=1 Tax=Quadrisphaera sp. KR29 TaxID=3461391 RepID=UPI0040443B5E